MKVLVCGGRHFSNYSILSSVLDDCLAKCDYREEVEIVSGGCKGTDTLAEKYATENNYEGIREATTNGYMLDWNSDEPKDLVKLEGTCVHITKFNKCIRCYGYKVNKTPLNKNSRNKFLSYIKAESTQMRLELKSRCIEDFYSKCNIKDFDYVIKTPSRSSLNDDIINELGKFDDFQLIDASKKPVEHLELDMDEIDSKFKKDYKERFVKYLQNIIDANKKSGKFSISTFKPQYRNFIKPMIAFGNTEIVNDASTNLLIVDDIFTSGSTINMLLKLLNDINFQGNIVILTLFQNS